MKTETMSERIPYRLSIDYFEKEDLNAVLKELDFVDLVYDETFECIKHAVKNKKTRALLFEVNESGVYLTINDTEYETSLLSVLKYYENTEQYEKCIKVNKLIKSIE